MSLVLRTATREDVEEIAALIPAAVRKLSQGHYTAEQVEAALAHVFGVDTQLIADETYCVAEFGGKIVGCGGWSRRETLYGGDQSKPARPEPMLDPALDPARLRAFYVRPDWARRGVGTAILRRCEEAARAAGFLRMELVATLPGVPLYSARGYQEMGPVEIRMPGGLTLPSVRMGKSLAAPAKISPRP